MATQSVLDESTLALERIQQFDVSSLGREDDLGKQMSFSEAITSAGVKSKNCCKFSPVTDVF